MDGTVSEAQAMGKSYDAIIIPGGGLEPDTLLPQPWVCARLDTALKLSAQTRFFVALSRGTTHRSPPLDSHGFPILESAASAKYLVENGIEDPSRILLDGWSLDTIGNAFFASKMICEPMRLTRCLLITSAFHMPRTRAIFDWVFKMNELKFELDYCVTPDVGFDGAQSSARVERENSSLRTLQEHTIPRVNNIEKLSEFVFQQHGAYNAQAVITNSQERAKGGKDSDAAAKAVTSTY